MISQGSGFKMVCFFCLFLPPGVLGRGMCMGEVTISYIEQEGDRVFPPDWKNGSRNKTCQGGDSWLYVASSGSKLRPGLLAGRASPAPGNNAAEEFPSLQGCHLAADAERLPVVQFCYTTAMAMAPLVTAGHGCPGHA